MWSSSTGLCLILYLKERKINLVSLSEHIDTTTATGMLFLQFIAMLAEFERNLISERTRAGLEAARARGRKGGRPKLQATSSKVVVARQLFANKKNSIREICKTLHISRSTLYRYIGITEGQAPVKTYLARCVRPVGNNGTVRPVPLFPTGLFTAWRAHWCCVGPTWWHAQFRAYPLIEKWRGCVGGTTMNAQQGI